MADTKSAFLWAIKQQESGGDYSAVQSTTGALGAYQVLPSNLPSWLKQAGLPAMTAQQFLSNPSAQDSLANSILGGYYDKYGASGAASMWYSGSPNSTAGASANGPSVANYVSQVLARMTSAPPVTGAAATGTPTGLIPGPLLPHLPTDVPGLGDIGGAIGDGIQKGIISGLASVLAPMLKWVIWTVEAGLGIGVIVGGVLVMLQNSSIVRRAEAVGTGAVLGGPEGAAAGKQVSDKVEATVEQKEMVKELKLRERRVARAKAKKALDEKSPSGGGPKNAQEMGDVLKKNHAENARRRQRELDEAPTRNAITGVKE